MKLDIISRQHPGHHRALQKYPIRGTDTVGVHGDEPYSIKVENASAGKIQVGIFVDGVNVQTGEFNHLSDPANLPSSAYNWVIEGNQSMELVSWPENREGGGAFVFTSVGNTVALHEHGDLSGKGFISCVIFVEGYIPPKNVYTVASVNYRSGRKGSGQSMETAAGMATADPGPGTGVGQWQEQKIVSVPGLRKPVFSHMIQVQYLWWNELMVLLTQLGVHPKRQEQGIRLKNTPRIGGDTHEVISHYSRFA